MILHYCSSPSEGTKLRLDPPYWRKPRLGRKFLRKVPRRATPQRVGADWRAVGSFSPKGFVFDKSVNYALQGEVGI